ncbi:universal stress protein [Hamadaea tsunoensis]|uniref:universal stress protein n=1 Tax=Hamadaea tsunoensis TaxID=53368 RepID=UPI00041DF54A|nr:universal stress protein [Hamadaea tsunoensis]
MPTDIPIKPVVAGVDGSAGGLAAARYAAHEAELRGAPLVLLAAYEIPMYGYFPTGMGYLPDDRPEIDEQLAALGKQLREEYPAVREISGRQVVGGAAGILIDESRRAQLTVVGCRGIGGFTELLLGSVSSQLIAHAESPVIVLRPPAAEVPPGPEQPPAPPAPDGPILVGVDGSPAGQTALRFAVDQARRRDVDLIALHVFPITATQTRDEVARAEAGARLVLADAVAPWAHEPGVRIQTRTLAAHNIQQAMIDAARTAGLIVVGSRGRGGFKGLLLGSVSQALVHHAVHPIAVIHADHQI